MIRLFFAALLCLTFMPPMAYANQTTPECSNTKSTGEHLQCLKVVYEKQQEDLNTLFMKALLPLNEEEEQTMKTAQKAWVTYRDLECSHEAITTENASLERLKTLQCLSQLTKERLNIVSKGQTKKPLSQYGDLPRWMNVLSDEHSEVIWDFADRIEGDLDCDQKNEYAMHGIEISKEGVENLVVAVAESAKTGKPRTQSFTLPLDSEICNPKIMISIETSALQSRPEEKTENATEEIAQSPALKSCTHFLKISDGECYEAHLVATDNGYTLGPNLIASAPKEKPSTQDTEESKEK